MARRKRDSLRKRKNWFGKGTKSRKALVGFVIAVAVILLLGVVGFYQLLAWLQGDGFRERMEESLCNRAQAERVEIPQNFVIQGSRVSLPAFRMERKGLLNEVAAKRISSELERRALLDRHLKFDKLTVEELAINMDLSRIGEELPEKEKKERSFWDRFKPKDTTLGSFECKDTDVDLLAGGKHYGLSGISVSAYPQSKGDTSGPWQLDFENGRLRVPSSVYYLQDCSVKTATLLITPGEEENQENYNLSNCRIQLSPGEINLKGSFDRKSKHWSVSMSVSKANVGRMLLGDWKKKLTGELFGSLKFTATGSGISEASGSLQLRQGVLEGLPILSEIELGNTKPFRTIHLAKAECRMHYPYNEPRHNISGAWLFDGIDIRSKDDNLRVTGHVIIGPDGELGGTLSIGISKAMLREFDLDGNEILAELFTGKGDEGYRWVNLNLSGTIDAPQEDLSVRISTIMAKSIPELAGRAIKSTGGALLNMLTGGRSGAAKDDAPQPPQTSPGAEAPAAPKDDATPKDGTAPGSVIDQATDAAGDIIDKATDTAGGIIESGLNLFF